MTLPTTRQITDSAMAYGRLAGHIRAFLPVINIDTHGNVTGLDTLKDAVEIIAAKRATKEMRALDDADGGTTHPCVSTKPTLMESRCCTSHAAAALAASTATAGSLEQPSHG